MKPLRPVDAVFRIATALLLLAWLPALFGWWAARVLYVLSLPVVAGLSLFIAFRRPS
ncbi:hypothetical protein [Vitiosangium sp. GDMCC 1.1324]|uniref:hypothetical protein n=1 Tax=Vitiosangium sp. (strain GDMCC 1.1324) TaxID=2138576 RepID=UPI00130E8A9F|nr:hypothetical protein [Vitiosangium sp. GDMCC 1.1324]